MQIVNNISNDAKQKHTILFEKDSSRIVLEMSYNPTQLGWFLNVTYEDKDFKVNGLRITTNSNLLNQWRNILPFGIICQCNDAQDPLLIEDFIVGRARLAILNEEEMAEITELQRELKADD